MVLSVDNADNALAEGEATASEDSSNQEIDKPALMMESMKLGLFQMEIIEGKIKALLGGGSANMMVTALKAREAQWSRA